MAVLAILLFISIFLLILYGYPVAFTLGGISIIYALCFLDPSSFSALPPRIMGVMPVTKVSVSDLAKFLADLPPDTRVVGSVEECDAKNLDHEVISLDYILTILRHGEYEPEDGMG